MHIISATSPQWANTEQSAINLNADFEGIGILPFSAAANDTEAHGRDLFSRAVAGEFGAIAALPPLPLAAVKAEKLKQLEAARKNAITTLPPVTVAGKQFPADSEYQGVISNLSRRLAAARPVPATVRGVDGVAVTLNAVLLNQLDDAISGAVQAMWDRYWTKFDALQAATTVDAVGLISW